MAETAPSMDHRDPAIRIVLLPRDTNNQGTIFGGVILSHIDLAGAVEVGKTTRQRIVTAGIDKVDFKAPVMVGEVVSFYTSTARIGKTSITVHVDVEVKRSGKFIHVTEADLTFVCIDPEGKPTAVIKE
jgi:acyl-CoA thioesterase YciA